MRSAICVSENAGDFTLLLGISADVLVNTHTQMQSTNTMNYCIQRLLIVIVVVDKVVNTVTVRKV